MTKSLRLLITSCLHAQHYHSPMFQTGLIRWNDKWRRRSWKAEYCTRAPSKQFVLKRNGKEGRLLWNPKVNTVNKVEHNHPDLILRLPEGLTAFIEFNVCRDESVVEHKRHPVVLPIVVERAKFKEDKY